MANGVNDDRAAVDAALGRNLATARAIAGMTQQELAERARVSRATIALIEAGSSDPRLSTINQLAGALGISPLVLLMDRATVAALVRLAGSSPPPVETSQVSRMRQLISSNLRGDYARAARIGAAWARPLDRALPSVPLTAAIFSAAIPGPGTSVGAVLGKHLPADTAVCIPAEMSIA